jgi:hypothetical protein
MRRPADVTQCLSPRLTQCLSPRCDAVPVPAIGGRLPVAYSRNPEPRSPDRGILWDNMPLWALASAASTGRANTHPRWDWLRCVARRARRPRAQPVPPCPTVLAVFLLRAGWSSATVWAAISPRGEVDSRGSTILGRFRSRARPGSGSSRPGREGGPLVCLESGPHRLDESQLGHVSQGFECTLPFFFRRGMRGFEREVKTRWKNNSDKN